MTNNVTIGDVRRAFDRYCNLIDEAGIPIFKTDLEPNPNHRPPRLILSEGSKTYGIAYRINATDVPHHCQNCRARHRYHDGMDPERYDLEPGTYDPDCTWCEGTGVESCSGHFNPPIGSDYLGMTKREAYDTLQERNAAIADTIHALKEAT